MLSVCSFLFLLRRARARVFAVVSRTSAARKRDNEIKFMAPDPQRKYDNRG